jgi:hypothetical protein
VNAQQDPELKDLLLGGELNMVMCMECARVQYQDHFVLYQDKEIELVAYVYPEKQKEQAEELTKITLQGFREAQDVFDASKRLDYEPELFFGLESLVRLLQADEEQHEQSDVAKAVCKEHQIPVAVLRPSFARKQKLLRAVPGGENMKALSRPAVLQGLSQLLKANPLLTLYAALQKKIEADPSWSLTLPSL